MYIFSKNCKWFIAFLDQMVNCRIDTASYFDVWFDVLAMDSVYNSG